MNEWKAMDSKTLGIDESNFQNYQTKGVDWIEFDCVCQDKDAPDYENLPYDFQMPELSPHTFTCSRCGRMYRVSCSVNVQMYEPLAIRYPNSHDKMPSETLGLRVRE